MCSGGWPSLTQELPRYVLLSEIKRSQSFQTTLVQVVPKILKVGSFLGDYIMTELTMYKDYISRILALR